MKRARDYRREAWVALGEGQYWPFVGAMFILTLISAFESLDPMNECPFMTQLEFSR